MNIEMPNIEMPNLEDCRTNFLSVLVYGTIETSDENEREIREAYPDETPHYWSVYGRLPDGTSKWIADFGNQLLAWYCASSVSCAMQIPIEKMMIDPFYMVKVIHSINTPHPVH